MDNEENCKCRHCGLQGGTVELAYVADILTYAPCVIGRDVEDGAEAFRFDLRERQAYTQTTVGYAIAPLRFLPPRKCVSPPFMSFRVGMAQINPKLGDVAANMALYEAGVRQAADQDVHLVVFPELSLTGYFLRDMVPDVAVRLSSPEMERLKALSRDVSLVAGLVLESEDHRFFNTAVYLEDGEVRHIHRKVYLPTYGMFDEQRYFARGGRLRAFDTRHGRLALLICEDLWHPSTVHLAALDGALTILCPSSSPLRGVTDGADQDDNARYWELITRSYAETYGVFVVHANRVGFEDGVGFWGGSGILDPFGRTVCKADYYEEAFVAGEVSDEVVRRKRTQAPLMRDEDVDLTIRELERIRRE